MEPDGHKDMAGRQEPGSESKLEGELPGLLVGHRRHCGHDGSVWRGRGRSRAHPKKERPSEQLCNLRGHPVSGVQTIRSRRAQEQLRLVQPDLCLQCRERFGRQCQLHEGLLV